MVVLNRFSICSQNLTVLKLEQPASPTCGCHSGSNSRRKFGRIVPRIEVFAIVGPFVRLRREESGKVHRLRKEKAMSPNTNPDPSFVVRARRAGRCAVAEERDAAFPPQHRMAIEHPQRWRFVFSRVFDGGGASFIPSSKTHPAARKKDHHNDDDDSDHNDDEENESEEMKGCEGKAGFILKILVLISKWLPYLLFYFLERSAFRVVSPFPSRPGEQSSRSSLNSSCESW